MAKIIFKIGIGLMASGNSRRMGENKLLMKVKGKTMAEHMMEKLVKLNSEVKEYELAIIVASCYKEILALGKKNKFKTVYNHHNDRGQSESIKLITKELSYCDGIVFLPCDQIFIKWDSINSLIKTFIKQGGNIPVQACHKGKKSSPVIFPKAFYKELLKLEEDAGGRTLLQDKMVDFLEIEEKETIDIDTKMDIKNIRLDS